MGESRQPLQTFRRCRRHQRRIYGCYACRLKPRRKQRVVRAFYPMKRQAHRSPISTTEIREAERLRYHTPVVFPHQVWVPNPRKGLAVNHERTIIAA